ncbi:M48 family metallopeptidase [Deinococcus planocerae]|uniref:M48 family metallopeptidase n=1 Tax=Deinococcus planocerae TaxID=1737569 RepID=UPI001FEAB384|nr:M48 family metallopeptidase [Deinococcus planocerae]
MRPELGEGSATLSAWQRLSDREAAQTRDAFLRSPDPRRSSRRALALTLAALILTGYTGMTLLSLWLGWLALAPLFGTAPESSPILRFFQGLGSLTLLLFAVQARPRFPRLPGWEVKEAQAPELHRLIREVAAALDVPPPARVTVDGEVNAFMGRSGFPPRSTLGLGLPLLYALPPQERVAIIAHELAHERNGDPTRGGVVGLALNVLGHAVSVLTPDGLMTASSDLLQAFAQGTMRVFSLIPLGLYHLLLSLVGGDQQRAEFRADLLASRVAGSAATTSLLDHLHLTDSLESALHKQRHQPERPNAFLELRHIWATMPETRRQGRRDETAAEKHPARRHPSTHRRTDRRRPGPPDAPGGDAGRHAGGTAGKGTPPLRRARRAGGLRGLPCPVRGLVTAEVWRPLRRPVRSGSGIPVFQTLRPGAARVRRAAR